MIAAALLAGAAAASCTMPPGWEAVERRGTRYVIFGEYHGTNEAPAFVADVACALARRGERVLVAIEQNALDDGGLQVVWHLPHARFVTALRKLPNWVGRDDGVGSMAMFKLLVRLHGLSAVGQPIGIVAFNGNRDKEQAKRFAALPF